MNRWPVSGWEIESNLGSLIHGHTIPLEVGKGTKFSVCVVYGAGGPSLLLSFTELMNPIGKPQAPQIQGPRMAVPSRALLEERLALAKKKKKEKKEEKKAAHRRVVERRRQQKKEKKKKEDKKKELFHILLYSLPVPPSLSVLRNPRRLRLRL